MKISDKEINTLCNAVLATMRAQIATMREPEQLEIPEFLKKDKGEREEKEEKSQTLGDLLRASAPELGSSSFLVFNEQSSKYTIIGADNIHHAEMKATKLFGQGWTGIDYNSREESTLAFQKGYRFLPVVKFNQLIALLQSS